MMHSIDYGADYKDTFQTLLSLDQRFNILSLVENEIDMGASSPAAMGSILSRVFGSRQPSSSTTELNKQASKLFCRKIKNWSETLDAELYRARYEPELLTNLKEVVEKIFVDCKIYILKGKLQERNLFSQKVEKAVVRLEEIVNRTLHTLPLEQLKASSDNNAEPSPLRGAIRPMTLGLGGLFYSPFSFFPVRPPPHVENPPIQEDPNEGKMKKVRSESDLWKSSDSCPTHPREIKRRSDIEDLRGDTSDHIKHLRERQQAKKLSLFNHSWGKGWEDKLHEEFKQLNEVKAIITFAKELEPMQALCLIERTIHDEKHEWKLIYLIGSLEHTTFIEIVNAFDATLLSFTNQALKRSSKESLEWFEEAFARHRDDIIGSCNSIKSRIDALAKRFRDDDKGYLLMGSDLNHIWELRDNIDLRIPLIKEKLIPLLDGVIMHPETRHVLSKEVIKEYKFLRKRLTEKKDDDDGPAGYLLPIIYRDVFERGDHEDSEAAFEMLAEWSVFNKDDYLKVGLLGNISNETFETLSNISSDSNIFTVSQQNLKNLGIKTITDWKRLNIFNWTMLENFLKRKDNQSKLTQWTREAIRP